MDGNNFNPSHTMTPAAPNTSSRQQLRSSKLMTSPTKGSLLKTPLSTRRHQLRDITNSNTKKNELIFHVPPSASAVQSASQTNSAKRLNKLSPLAPSKLSQQISHR